MTGILNNPLDIAAFVAGGVLLLVLLARLAKAARRAGDARVVQVVALSITMSYSGLTSWQWATTRLHAPVWERGIVFAAFEVVMLAFAVASRENRLRDGRSGWQHGATLFFAGLMSLMALQVAGSPMVAAVRFGGGPLAALLLFHSLLGLELRHQGTDRESLLRAALREVRERIVSRLGIGRRGADSAAIARSRAADRAVTLAARRTLRPHAARRLAVAIDAARHGLDEGDAAAAEAAIVARIVRRKSVAGLHSLEARHQWLTPTVSVVDMIEPRAEEIAGADTTEDIAASAEPVISGWTGPRASGPRRPARRPRHLRPARPRQAPQTAAEQPQPAPEPVRVDTVETETTVASQGGKRRPSVRPAVIALKAQNPDMPVDTIAEILGVAERTVTRHLSAKDTQIEHANGTTV